MNNSQIEQYKIEEAKKRMGTSAANVGMTNTVAGNAGMTNSVVSANANLKKSEKVKAQEDMNKTNTMY